MVTDRVLLFEDDLLLATDLASELSAEYEVDIAQDLEEAILLAKGTEYVALVSDLFVEGDEAGGGVTLIGALRSGLRDLPAWGRDVPIVAMTGAQPFNGFDALEVAANLGANATVRKPIDIENLLGTLALHIRQREPAPSPE